MSRRSGSWTLLWLGLLAAQACTTKSTMRSAPSDAGVKQSYAFPIEKVRLAARDALGETGFNIRERESVTLSESLFEVNASQGLSSGYPGRRARVRIEDQKDQCQVHVLVRSKLDSQEAIPADTAMAEEIQKSIGKRLK